MSNKQPEVIGGKFSGKISFDDLEFSEIHTKKVEVDLVMPANQWEMWLTNYVKETGVENCGLFCQAKNEKEAKKIFNNLIKLIQEKEIEK